MKLTPDSAATAWDSRAGIHMHYTENRRVKIIKLVVFRSLAIIFTILAACL
jgi:hypothetical protein